MSGREARVARLADAAMELLAEGGMRALTHRAVDGRAGMPPGTTSAYLRTRQALIEAVVRRLAELDAADLAARDLSAGAAAVRGPDDLDRLAVGAAEVLDRWLSTERTRALARYACLLEAVHRPELRPVLDHGTALRVQARDLLAQAGAPDPHRQGDHFVAFVDGLLFDRLVGTGGLTAPTPGTPASRDDLRAAIRTLLRALTGA